ncbi:MAG: LysM domain-containing protein [Candidatus Sumerlaeota bacterium]|nr:LysM domain-containing protein [Candidatus Sumerlaeota bacterium]
MFPLIRSLVLPILALTVLIGMLTACGQQNPLDTPQMKDMSEGVKELKAEVRIVRKNMTELEHDIQATNSELQDLKGAPATAKLSPEVVKEINALKTELGALKTEMDKMRTELANAQKSKAGGGATPSGEAKSDERGPKAGASGKGKEPKDNRDVKEVKPGANAPAAKAAGEYYYVKKGDTMESVATAHKITADKLREANSIPAGKNPTEGARIYIPAP